MTESVSITNQEVLDESENIIINDKGLSNKISTLQELNKEFTTNQLKWDFPIICTILVTIFLHVEGLFSLFFMIWGIIWVLGRFHNFQYYLP